MNLSPWTLPAPLPGATLLKPLSSARTGFHASVPTASRPHGSSLPSVSRSAYQRHTGHVPAQSASSATCGHFTELRRMASSAPGGSQAPR